MSSKRTSWIGLVFALAALPACGDSSFGEFSVSDVRAHHSCFDELFPFEPNFLTARGRQGSVGLFMQSDGGNFQDTDVIYLEVFDSDTVSDGDTLTFSPPGTLDSEALGDLEFGTSCPDLVESLYIVGDVNFSRFNAGQDGLIEGELVGASVWSSRSQEMIAGALEGSWSIEVRTGQPYEEFYVTQ